MPAVDADQQVAALADQLARLQRQVDQLERSSNATRLAAASVENTGIPVNDRDGRMVARIGRQPDGTIVGGAQVGWQAPPETPKAPTVVVGIGTLKVQSNGSTDPPWPANFSHLNVWLSLDDDQAQAGIVGTIVGPANGVHIIAGLDYKPYRIWFTSVNVSGAESQRSEYVVAAPTPVVAQDILDGIIDDTKLADEAVTAAKIATAAIANYHFGDKVVDLRALGDDSVGEDQIAVAAILARHIGAEQVTAAAIASAAVLAQHIAAEQIQAQHFTADSVTARAIAALSILAEHMSANSVTAGAIQAGAVLAEHIRAGEVLADISITTGDGAGRRIVFDGPNNEIRFYPSQSNLNYGRLFSYTPADYPNDVNIELRAINSSQSNVLPRLYLTPDLIVAGVVDAAAVDTFRGGVMLLSEDGGFLGMRNTSGLTAGMGIYSDGEIQLEGFVKNARPPRPSEGLYLLAVSITNSGSSPIYVATVGYGTTLLTPMIPILSAGIVGAAVKKQMWTVRDEGNGLTGFFIRFGLSQSATTGDVGESPGIPVGVSAKIRALCVRTDNALSVV